MISYDEALDLLRRYISDESIIMHCKGVSNVAYSLAMRIKHQHPDLGIDPHKVRIGALLHDIGKARPGTHEKNSVQICREEGLDNIAEIVLHGYLYEISVNEENPDESLLPHSIENKIVTYADFRFKDRPMSLRERIDDIKVRKKDEVDNIKALKMAEHRFYALESEIHTLVS